MEQLRHKVMADNVRRFGDPQGAQAPRDRMRAQSELLIPRSRTSYVREEQPLRQKPTLPLPPRCDPTSSVPPINSLPSISNVGADAPLTPKPIAEPVRIPSVTTKDWTLATLLQKSSNFQQVPRVSWNDKSWIAMAEECERQGIPLIIEDWHTHPRWSKAFDADWLVCQQGDDVLSARNLGNYKDTDMTLGDFVEYSRTASQYSVEDKPLYAKDVDCPKMWRKWLHSDVLPSDLRPGGSKDLLKHLPPSEQVETIMCYYGIGDTFTPCHKDLCGSTGHNLMCHTENGSSFWFLTASDAAPEVAKYFQDVLKQELDWENYITTVDDLKDTPFMVYVAEQKLGDLILIPPRSCHQVINHGGLTMKLSWSRMTLKGLTTALLYELPIYRRVCRPEIYRVKSVLYHSLRYYADELAAEQEAGAKQVRRRIGDAATLNLLVPLFDAVLREEYGELASGANDDCTSRGVSVRSDSARPAPSSLPNDRAANDKDQLSCDFCGADIFQSYFKCDECCPMSVASNQYQGGPLVICPTCYVEGRSCKCTNMTPMQRYKTEDLLTHRNKAARVLRSLGIGDSSQKAILTPEELKNGDDVCVFQAACALHARHAEYLRKPVEDITCRRVSTHIHKVSYLSAVYCKDCHQRHCFMHLLDMGVHSSEAFLSIKGTSWKGDSEWHQQHLKAKLDFANVKPALMSVEKTGLFAPQAARHNARLILAALNYRRCRAVNGTFTKPGFYDFDVTSIEVLHGAAPNNQESDAMEVESTTVFGTPPTPISVTPRARSLAQESAQSSRVEQVQSEEPAAVVDVTMLFDESPSTRLASRAIDAHADTRLVDKPSPPPSQANRAYILLPAVPPVSTQKKKRTSVVNRPSKRQRTEAGSRDKEIEHDWVEDDYGVGVVGAYRQVFQVTSPKRKRLTRRIDSPEPETDDPLSRVDQMPREQPSGSKRLSGRSQQPECEMKPTGKTNARRQPSQPFPMPTIFTSSSQWNHDKVKSVMQSPVANTTDSRVHIRGPRGKPPGKRASEFGAALDGANHEHLSKAATSAAQRHDGHRPDNANRIKPNLERAFRQSEAARVALEDEKRTAGQKLEKAERELTITRSECEKLKQELQLSLQTAENNKQRVHMLEQNLENMKNALIAKEKQFEEQKGHFMEQGRRIAEQQIRLVEQTKELEEHKEVFQYLATEFERHLSNAATLTPAAVQNALQLVFGQIQPNLEGFVAEIISRAAQRQLTGSIGPRFEAGNDRRFAFNPCQSTGPATAQPQRVYYGRDDQRTGRRMMNTDRTMTHPSSGWSTNGQDGHQRTFSNHGQTDRYGRGPHTNHSSHQQSRYHSRGPTDVSQWVATSNANRANPPFERRRFSCSPPGRQRDRSQPRDIYTHGRTRRSRSPPRQRYIEPPQRDPSIISNRGPPRTNRDQSRHASPEQGRRSSTRNRADTPESQYWEDGYGRDDDDECRTSVLGASTPRHSSSASSSLRGAQGAGQSGSDPHGSDASNKSETAQQSQSPEPSS